MTTAPVDNGLGQGVFETGVDMLSIWLGIGGLLFAALAGALLIHTVRRHYSRRSDAGAEAFSLQDLRALRDQGQLSQKEYEHLRTSLLGRVAEPASDSEMEDAPTD